jgi:hypothetical protein
MQFSGANKLVKYLTQPTLPLPLLWKFPSRARRAKMLKLSPTLPSTRCLTYSHICRMLRI